MKIVQIAAIESTHIKLLKALNEESVKKGAEVHCVCTTGNKKKELQKQGVIVHDIKIDRKISLLGNIKSIYRMLKLFKKLKPDIVHTHTPVASVLGRIAAKLAKVPNIIYTAHGFYFHDGMSKKTYFIYFHIEKIIGKICTDYIFTQSREDYITAKKNNFLRKKKQNNYFHISNGIDLNNEFNINNISEKKIKDIKLKHNIKKGDIIVTFIGRLVKEKGILDLLEAYSKLESKNVKFIIIGSLSDSERDKDTIKIIEKYKKNTDVIFTGQISNINEYLTLSDIYCLPSYREGMPRSIIEAMAMKNAIIATKIRGSREEVVENETGYLIPLKSSKYIASKIDNLVGNVEILNNFKEAGYFRALQIYNEEEVIKKQWKVFRKLVK
ncbi:glycosyltransferase involved in cell wall biosynthesis [Staphylococcus saprophyticus]|uniref:glycosyltransferase family 4 protein n=1 Tax=Staphylococcus TaxID=1279 RepID=UPI00085A355B|nr:MULTISPECIES: glycosyltransferase family 4 protein [Staphylococcus]AYX91047.1 glycosyltransferase family 1 protein [Staphylococcus cohnii]MBN6851525.1 glycosyltransferase family 4 protein [Staphylococcus saprophyticus]MDK9877479.1 glycosyltransferase family 4 protein [Staphylococcus equorum]MDN6850684.1 glycosyltransferase family 4 protein [Staphylococcus equorum]MDW3893232.1 glycosyltransferase family 4 protein [Staphylococcus saprophyticus]